MTMSGHESGRRGVQSPCVNICALDINDVCVGCYRTGVEIAAWGSMSHEQRLEVLKRVALREAQSGRII